MNYVWSFHPRAVHQSSVISCKRPKKEIYIVSLSFPNVKRHPAWWIKNCSWTYNLFILEIEKKWKPLILCLGFLLTIHFQENNSFIFNLLWTIFFLLDPRIVLGKSTSEKGSSKSQNIRDLVTELLKAGQT